MFRLCFLAGRHSLVVDAYDAHDCHFISALVLAGASVMFVPVFSALTCMAHSHIVSDTSATARSAAVITNLTWLRHTQPHFEILNMTTGSSIEPSFTTSLIAGGTAGVAVDIALFPIDTVKTRLQSQHGFKKSGGFRHLYRGIGAAAVGSAPNAALFFCAYDSIKKYAKPHVSLEYAPVLHMGAAALAELASCLIKVPTEILKQRQQASMIQRTNLEVIKSCYRSEGFFGFYRGFQSTVIREIPFSIIQLPMWELFMKHWSDVTGQPLTPLEVSACGALSGGISAAVTTPLDVAKTRIMLADVNDSDRLGISRMLVSIYRIGGVPALFVGFVPRVIWITLGGSIFFGIYGATKEVLIAMQ